MAGIGIAVVGLGFGREFVPLYLAHPEVGRVVVVDADPARARAVADEFGIPDGDIAPDLDAVLADPGIDAVHLLTPVPTHADLSVRVLDSGRHCACAVPMATSLDDLARVLDAQERSGRAYMMMETAAFAREQLEVERMLAAGELGEVTAYRGFHLQNIDGFPVYWQGFPPLHYVTHALSPALALLGTRVVRVAARGSGVLTPEQTTGGYDNPFPRETGLFELADSPVVAEATVAFFNTARAYVEGFAVYGTRAGVEWPEDNVGPLTVHRMSAPEPGHRGNPVAVSRVEAPDRPELLPEPLRAHLAGSGHGGSHPHLVHAFVSALAEGRAPAIDAVRAAEWTAPGIVGHASALRRGEWLDLPDYR
jgi:predicted dehydrogenase